MEEERGRAKARPYNATTEKTEEKSRREAGATKCARATKTSEVDLEIFAVWGFRHDVEVVDQAGFDDENGQYDVTGFIDA